VESSQAATTWARSISEVSHTQDEAVGGMRDRLARVAEISRRNTEGTEQLAATAESQARSVHEVEGATRELRELATYLGDLARRLSRIGQR